MNLQHETQPFTKISDVEIPEIYFNRFTSGNDNLDNIFGEGGLLPGSTITIKALPGAGKSVFCLTLAEALTKKGYRVGYSSGEESHYQIAYNCKRLGIEDLKVSTITDIDELLVHIPNLDFLVIDSFQTVTINKDLSTPKKAEYCINNLVKKAKEHNCCLLFIVQETSTGEIRGGPTLLYAVDVNLEVIKDKFDKTVRIINNYKNRFGATLKHATKFDKNGYEFLGEYMEEDETKKKVKTGPIKETRKEEIMTMIEPPLITVQRVMDHFDVKEQTAKILLTELENDMKLIKYGRGITAIWKVLLK